MPLMPSSVLNSTMVRKAYGACNPYELSKGGSEIIMLCKFMDDMNN